MAHSFIKFRGRGYHRTDSAIVVVAGLVVRAAKNAGDGGNAYAKLSGLFDYWREQFPAGYGGGYVTPALDEYLTEEAAVDCLVGLIRESKKYVSSFGERIPAKVLSEAASELLGWEDDFRRVDGKEWPVSQVSEWIEEWEKLLLGQGGQQMKAH